MTVAQFERSDAIFWQQQNVSEQPRLGRVMNKVAEMSKQIVYGSILHFAFGRRTNTPPVPLPSHGGSKDGSRKPTQDKREKPCATPNCTGIPVGSNAHCNFCLEAANRRRANNDHLLRTGHDTGGNKPHKKRRFWQTTVKES